MENIIHDLIGDMLCLCREVLEHEPTSIQYDMCNKIVNLVNKYLDIIEKIKGVD